MTTLFKTSASGKEGYAEAVSGADKMLTHPVADAVSIPQIQSEELTLDQLTEKLSRENPGFAEGLSQELKKFSVLGTTDDGEVTLTSLRMAAGLTQTQLAERVGLKQSNISHIEAGQNGNLKRETMVRLCQALGCDMNTINAAVENALAMLNEYHAKQEMLRQAERNAA